MKDALNLSLERGGGAPLYAQIAQQLRELILKGRFPEGGKLPPTRKLAQGLGVNRSTVVQAYDKLWSEGLIEGHVGRGTIVQGVTPRTVNPLSPLPWEMLLADRGVALEREVDELIRLFAREDLISFAAGLPSPDLYPIEEVSKITGDLLRREGRALLQWCAVEGYLPLRERLSMRIPGVLPNEILILAGSTEGLYLLATTFLESGDCVIVESPTYLGALQAFRAVGARIVGIPVGEEGMDLNVLENVLARSSPKFIYTLPTFQNPTGNTMSLEKRRELLSLAYHYRIPIVEDDPYSLLRYEEGTIPSLKALDTYGHVIYLSTFSKVLFPGLRVGWLAAPKQVQRRLASAKYLLNLFTNSLCQAVIDQFFVRDLFESHLRKVCQAYRVRRDAMVKALNACGGFDFVIPKGGYSLWPRLPRGVSARSLLNEALREGVSFVLGEVFYPDGTGQEHIRMNFTSQTPERIEEGVRRLGRALRRLKRRKAEEKSEAKTFIKPIV
jgi:2-aminoadipate transaminase